MTVLSGEGTSVAYSCACRSLGRFCRDLFDRAQSLTSGACEGWRCAPESRPSRRSRRRCFGEAFKPLCDCTDTSRIAVARSVPSAMSSRHCRHRRRTRCFENSFPSPTQTPPSQPRVPARCACRRGFRAAGQRRPVGYSSPRCPQRRSRSRPMNHPITNAANRNAMITPMLTST